MDKKEKKKENILANASRQSRKWEFFLWFDLETSVETRSFILVVVGRGRVWCVCVAAGAAEDPGAERWTYSAVIHKVESTTKLIATV